MTEGAEGETKVVSSRRLGMVLFQSVLVVVLLFAIVFWTQREWPSVRAAFETLSPLSLLGGVGLASTGVIASALGWRAMLIALGQQAAVIPASVVYLVGQLGKFIPGGFWAFLYQIALGVRRGFAKTPTGLAGPLNAGIGLATGAAMLGLGLSVVDVPLPWLYPILGVVPIAAAIVWPKALNTLIRAALRLGRRGDREIAFTRHSIAVISSWATVSWICYGMQLFLITSGLDYPLSPLQTIGLVAAAQSLGFLAVIVPSGLGVREAVIVAGLSGVTDAGSALTIALATRATSTLGDFLAAGTARLIEFLQSLKGK